MASEKYSVDEVVAALRHSSLSNLIVEGPDDVEVLRNLEAKLRQDIPDIDFVVVGDKGSVLAAWERRSEMHPGRVSFLADSDLWLFSNERENYPGVIFIDGYSIENNCLASEEIQRLVTARPITAECWYSALRSLTRWFSAEIWFSKNGQPYRINRGFDGLVDQGNNFALTEEAEARIAQVNEEERAQIEAVISDDPIKHIIGKVLVLAMKDVLEHCENFNLGKRGLLLLGSKLGSPSLDALSARIVNSFLPDVAEHH